MKARCRTWPVIGRGLPDRVARYFGLIPATAQVDKTFLEGADFAEPLVFAGFGEALLGVFAHGFEASGLGRIDLKEAAFDAGVLVNARGGIGTMAGAQRDPAEEELLLEFSLSCCAAEFMVGAGLPAAFNEGVVCLDDVFGKACCVSSGHGPGRSPALSRRSTATCRPVPR